MCRNISLDIHTGFSHPIQYDLAAGQIQYRLTLGQLSSGGKATTAPAIQVNEPVGVVIAGLDNVRSITGPKAGAVFELRFTSVARNGPSGASRSTETLAVTLLPESSMTLISQRW